MAAFRSVYGDLLLEAPGDMWKVLVDKAGGEAYDKIEMIYPGESLKTYGVVYRWISDVSGLGLAEHARRLMHPIPLEKEKDLAEHVEMWQDGNVEQTEMSKNWPRFSKSTLRGSGHFSCE